MAGTSLLGIGTSGLQAYQRSLTTIGNNIANVNTEGYSRQRVELSTRPPQSNGFGFAGTGVEVSTISRSFNTYIESGVRSSTSAAAESESFHALATQIDNVIADPDTGVATSIQRYFNAMQDVADTPSSTAAREVLLSEGRQLAGRFNELGSWLDGVRSQVNGEIRGSVGEINSLSDGIARLNESIVLARGQSGGQEPNDLLDKRDLLIRDLSKLVSVTTINQNNGAVNVLAGSGQALVVGNTASTLETFTEGNDPNSLGVAIRGTGGALVPITEQISGGSLGGVINFRDNMLNVTSNNLGLTAIGIGQFINDQQNQGMDLEGALGNDMFSVAQPAVQLLAGSANNVTATFNDVGQLTNKDYTLRFNAGAWQLSEENSGQVVSMTGTGTAVDPFIADGLSFEITSAPTNGDTYLIQPTRAGASDLQVVLANSRQIAAAAPLRSIAATTNAGSGEITAGVVTDINNPVFQGSAGQLSPPVLIRFTAGNSYDVYDNSSPGTPVLLESGITYNPATGGDVFPTPGGIDHGYSMRLTGAPSVGDEFSTEYNTGGVGDNRNALLMFAVSTNNLLANGASSINDSYNALVTNVGTQTKQAELKSLSQNSVLENAVSARESATGVNLDEEAANLIRFQQAYQATAQVIAVANSLFDTLLNATRR